MSILTWIILGALAGWVVSLIAKTNGEQGAFGNILVGIVGALIGGFLGSALFDLDVTGLNLTSILLAVAGGLVFTFLLGLFTGRKHV
jgi:uncharacterized membrane protein YeaQ/YmgE (transglycosylase-associated protein family)